MQGYEEQTVETTETKHSIQVIERMMKLLDALAKHEEPVSLKRLAHLTGLHPSSAHRILASMVEGRIVDRVEPGTYRLGLKLLDLGNLVKARIDVRQEALGPMQQLHAELGETVNLIMRQGDEIVYVERTASGTAMMRAIQIIGTRAPLHVTAVGKVFLAEEGDEACLAYARRTGLPPYTQNTFSDPNKLLAELARIRAQGYAFDNEEAEKGVCCVGAGIYDADRHVVAGLSISVPTERINKDWGRRVKDTADQISRALGHRPRH
jgi:IclR family KDG regulon transcriptional repressor